MIISEKSSYLNVVKGVAIFLMIWGHCIQYCAIQSFDFFENAIFKIIYSFHMPLFMIISGYLFYFSFQKRDLKNLIIHRTRPIIWTIIGGGIVIWFSTKCLFAVINGNYSIVFSGDWVKSFSTLWFLWSILSASIGVAIICKKVIQIWLQIPLLLLWGLVVLLFPNAESNLYMYPYYIIGFYFAKYKEKIPLKVMFFKYLSIPLFPIMCFYFEKKHYIYTSGLFGNGYVAGFWNIVKTDMFRWAIGLVGCIFVLVLIETIFLGCSKLKKKRHWKNFFLPLEKLGEKSLQVYVISIVFLSAYLPTVYIKVIGFIGIGNFFVDNIWIYNLIFTPILAIIYAIALYWIVKFLYKIKIGKFIFSK